MLFTFDPPPLDDDPPYQCPTCTLAEGDGREEHEHDLTCPQYLPRCSVCAVPMHPCDVDLGWCPRCSQAYYEEQQDARMGWPL
jgi:hypothetical protein